MAKISVKALVNQANKEVTLLTPATALSKQTAGDGILVDIRDIRELQNTGKVSDAVHAPRGMLEFWFDEQSPYHKPVFGDDSKTYILFCALGWRSALAAKSLKDMGFENIAHIDGGFEALSQEGAEIVPPKPLKS